MPYSNTQPSHTMNWPITDIVSVTPNDSTDLAGGITRGIMVTAAGNVSVITKNGTTVTIPVSENFPYPFSVGRIRSTGTTATGVFALY